MLAHHTKLALWVKARTRSIFLPKAADIKNATKCAQGDALVIEIEKTLVSQRELYAAVKTKEPQPDRGHASTASNLVSLAGACRDMKQTQKIRELNDMVKACNESVRSASGID